MREVVAGMRADCGKSRPQTLMTMNNLGSLLVELGKLDEAEALLPECYRGMSQTLGSDHFCTGGAASRLMVFCEVWGRPVQAAEWRAQPPPTQPAAPEARPPAGDE